jgi:hypothetical protein
MGSMSFRQKLLLYVYSTPNIVGSTLGLIGLLLFFAGIIKSFWPLIVIGLYGIGYFATPGSRDFELSYRHALDSESLASALDKLIAAVSNKLSDPVIERLQQLKQTVAQILPAMDRFQGSSQSLHAIRKTVTDYLPDMLETYLRLPPAYARFHAMQNGLTPRDMLTQQLDLLNEEMTRILEDLVRNDVDELNVHGKFLKDKFSKGQDWVN